MEGYVERNSQPLGSSGAKCLQKPISAPTALQRSAMFRTQKRFAPLEREIIVNVGPYKHFVPPGRGSRKVLPCRH